MKWIKYIEYVLLVICLLTFASLFVLPKVPFQGDMVGNPDFMLYWAYLIFGLTIVSALISPAMNIFKNPKSALKALIGLVAIVVLVGGCYLLSSDAPVVNSAGGFFEDPFTLKFTDTIIYLAYLLGGAAILTILFTEIRNAFK